MLQALTIGDTLAATIPLADYPASQGWVLHYRLADRAGVGAIITFDGAASGDDHVINVPASITASWTAGDYAVAAWVTSGIKRFTVGAECGQITLRPDPAQLAAGVDTRSHAALTLQAIRMRLAGKAGDGVSRYRINDREIESYSVPQLIKLENYWAAQVAAEERAAGLVNTRGQARRIRVCIR